MNRLTTDNPQNNLMTALNLFYAKDGQAWVRGGGPRPDYPDVTLYDYTRATIWKLLKTRSELAVLTDDDVQQIMDAWLLDGNNSIEGVIATLYTAGWAFAEIRARLAAFEDLEMTPDDIEQTMLRFSSFLMEMTGGRMSKTNYTVQAMVAEANDYQQKELEEAEQKAYDLGVDSVLRNHFDIPWPEAADLRKNIDHLRELMKAEREGRLMVLPPCKIGDTIYVITYTFSKKLEIREGTITGFRKGTRLQYVIFRYWNGGVPFDSSVPVEDLGKAWFLSQEEAEAALAKVNNVPGKTVTDTNVGSKEEE